jgi:hypothetical protein
VPAPKMMRVAVANSKFMYVLSLSPQTNCSLILLC